MKNKKIAYVVIAALLLAVAGFFGYQRMSAPAMSETETYVAEAFTAIVPTWNEAEMLKRQGTYMQHLDKDGKFTAKLFAVFRNLGALKETKPCRQVTVENNFPKTDNSVQPPTETASFHCAAVFEKDSAQIIFIIGKEQGEWKIAGFRLYSQFIDDLIKTPASKATDKAQ